MTRQGTTTSRRCLARALLACGLCLGLVAPVTSGELPPAEDVIRKHAQAIGGDALAKVKNMAAEFTFLMPAMGISTNGEAYVEVPAKSYSVISLASTGGSDFESGVNGDVVWQNNPQMGLRILEGNERRMAVRGTWLNPFGRWKELWDKAETIGEATVGEAACYKVVLTPSNGEPLTSYFDKANGLLVQEEIAVPSMGMTLVTKFGDHRDVGGMTVAHRIEQQGPMPWIIQYTSVRYNVDDIPEDTFELPQRIKELAAQ